MTDLIQQFSEFQATFLRGPKYNLEQLFKKYGDIVVYGLSTSLN